MEEIFNLDTARATEKPIIATLTSANASLAKELASLHRELSTLKPHDYSEQSRKIIFGRAEQTAIIIATCAQI